MKYLLVFAVLAIAFLWWNGKRKAMRRDASSRDAAAQAASSARADGTNALPQDMVRCPVCAVHLPRGDAVQGRLGLYCSPEHRTSAE